MMIPQSIRRTDSRLVRQALQGRRDSFNLLVERHFSGVYAVALARTQNHADAEDVVQEAFINAYTGLDKLREPGSFGGWVATIARNAAVKLRAKRNWESDGLDAETESAVVPDPARVELQELLRNKLSDLDDDAREVLLLHYFTGYSTREIADRLEISRDAALKRLQRSREKLAATMLAELEGSFDAHRPDMQKQVRRVTTAIAGMAVPWATQKAAAGALGKTALLAAGVGAVAVAAGVFLIGDGKSPAPASQATVPVAEASPVVMDTDQLDVVPVPIETDPASVVETSEPANVMEASEMPSLNGLWTLHQPKDAFDGPPRSDWPSSATVELKERGREVVMTVIASPTKRVRETIGTMEAGEIAFPLLDLVTIMWGSKPSAAQLALRPMAVGAFHPGAVRIRLVGPLPDVIADGTLPPEPFHIAMNKLDEDTAAFERKVQRLVVETRKIRDAILAYAYDHRGQLPASLRELVPRYLDELALVADDDERTIAYDSDAIDLMSAVHTLGEFDQFRPDLSIRERLFLWEEQRTAVYGDRFPDPADLLRVRIGQSPVSIRVGFHGEPEILDPNRPLLGQPNVEADDAERVRIESGECMNQIKHAGLAIAQFWNETEGQYTPAGWRSLVPEYMEDPTVLRCPRDEPGTLSYELLFPATSRAELAAIYADVHGLDASQVERESLMGGIPVAYEPKPHVIDGREFRTVLFLDGHVSLFHDRDWAKFVEPYLQYTVR